MNFLVFAHPCDLSLSQCFGALAVIAIPLTAIFMFTYIFVSRENQTF
jgi:hypothetical protein